jgi:streptogramin lyase
MDPEDEPVGGDFVGIQMPLGIFTGSHGPHSMAQIDDGRMYITAALSSSLFMFDPETEEFTRYNIPRGFLWRKGLYPHTIRADKDNNVWFTVTMSNRLMKFDTTTNEFTDIGLPSDSVLNWMTDVFMGAVLKIAGLFPHENAHMAMSHHKFLNGGKEVLSMPYGIDVHPLNGDIWYSKVIGNKIGRIDPNTLEITEYETPHRGPRRMRFDKDGILWIPSFDEGVLMRFDPVTEAFENIPLPLLSEGEWEVPYALNVHPDTGDVWIAANNSDRVLRYIPQEKRFITYPMPSRVVWFRDIEFTEDGQVCTSNANLPAYAHEDGLPAFVCIDPDGAVDKPSMENMHVTY